jgi:hypothetical protein
MAQRLLSARQDSPFRVFLNGAQPRSIPTPVAASPAPSTANVTDRPCMARQYITQSLGKIIRQCRREKRLSQDELVFASGLARNYDWRIHSIE